MIESREVEINTETSKNEIINTSTNISTINSLNNNVETLKIKPKVPQTKFENYVTDAYKKLVGFTERKKEEQKSDKNPLKFEDSEKLKLSECEMELRKA